MRKGDDMHDQHDDPELRRRAGLLEELEELGEAAATAIIYDPDDPTVQNILDGISAREGELSDMLGIQAMDTFWGSFYQSAADKLVDLPPEERGPALWALCHKLMTDAMAAGAFFYATQHTGGADQCHEDSDG